MTGSTNHTDPGEVLSQLRSAGPDTAEASTVERLLERLLATAESHQLTDATYRILDSPLGPLLLAGTERGLIRLAFQAQDHERVLDELAAAVGSRILRSNKGYDDAARQIDEYFSHTRDHFALPLDLRLAHGFRRTVLDHLREIPYGQTATYTQVAAAAGSERAVRAVGTACAKNPVPILIPCHRVLRSDGSTGGYAGGADAKRLLLDLEARDG
ncbi:methylated-DNA--[protein]-cysteine S-methyltransferase [Tomitella biformata]|uniref:methylated-DNA--[protein]-cysteine S-methyltransferase n=1 Tax=Tomitella biformata TaxID=630403 RepID=UPI00046353EC|nr:methylated-DNA--[protein]-cysteine S-methyltransferase [Tomitella biformata]